MMVDVERIAGRMASFPAALLHACGGIDRDDARWQPAAVDGGPAWSIVEIARHLLDEEREDFRPRLFATLEDPAAPWPPIDPEGVAVERAYRDADLAETLDAFARERAESVRLMRSMASASSGPAWDNTYVHPLGPITAGDLITSWCAHDALHLRQIAKRLYQLAQRDGGGFSPRYAGDWPEAS